MSTNRKFANPKEELQYRIDMQNSMILGDIWKTCTNCEEFDSHTETCGRYKVKPPAKIIVTGCVEHVTQIPF